MKVLEDLEFVTGQTESLSINREWHTIDRLIKNTVWGKLLFMFNFKDVYETSKELKLKRVYLIKVPELFVPNPPEKFRGLSHVTPITDVYCIAFDHMTKDGLCRSHYYVALPTNNDRELYDPKFYMTAKDHFAENNDCSGGGEVCIYSRLLNSKDKDNYKKTLLEFVNSDTLSESSEGCELLDSYKPVFTNCLDAVIESGHEVVSISGELYVSIVQESKHNTTFPDVIDVTIKDNYEETPWASCKLPLIKMFTCKFEEPNNHIKMAFYKTYLPKEKVHDYRPYVYNGDVFLVIDLTGSVTPKYPGSVLKDRYYKKNYEDTSKPLVLSKNGGLKDMDMYKHIGYTGELCSNIVILKVNKGVLYADCMYNEGRLMDLIENAVREGNIYLPVDPKAANADDDSITVDNYEIKTAKNLATEPINIMLTHHIHNGSKEIDRDIDNILYALGSDGYLSTLTIRDVAPDNGLDVLKIIE